MKIRDVRLREYVYCPKILNFGGQERNKIVLNFN